VKITLKTIERISALVVSKQLKLIELLLEAGGLASSTAQEVKLSATGLGMAFHHNLVNAGGAHQESSLNTDTVGCDATNCKSFSHTTMSDSDNRALELLDTLAFTFFDADMNGNCIPGAELRNIWVCYSFNGLQ
jgi:hypothetical protein